MRKATTTREVRYDFTNLEKAELGRRLGEAYQQQGDLEQEKKEAMAEFKVRAEGVHATIQKLAPMLTQGYQMRTLECTVLYNDPVQGRKSIFRADTGMLVGIEEMEWEEKQEQLPLEPPPPEEETPAVEPVPEPEQSVVSEQVSLSEWETAVGESASPTAGDPQPEYHMEPQNFPPAGYGKCGYCWDGIQLNEGGGTHTINGQIVPCPDFPQPIPEVPLNEFMSDGPALADESEISGRKTRKPRTRQQQEQPATKPRKRSGKRV